MMQTVTFTEFRNRASYFFNRIEHGESMMVIRHGRTIAKIAPAEHEKTILSWQKPAPILSIKGVSLSEAILKERKEAKK